MFSTGITAEGVSVGCGWFTWLVKGIGFPPSVQAELVTTLLGDTATTPLTSAGKLAPSRSAASLPREFP